MTYFVYIDLELASVPHMEPLDADCSTTATDEARERLLTHSTATAAHVYDGDTCVASVRLEELAR